MRVRWFSIRSQEGVRQRELSCMRFCHTLVSLLEGRAAFQLYGVVVGGSDGAQRLVLPAVEQWRVMAIARGATVARQRVSCAYY